MDATPKRVWHYLSAVENIHLWVPAINRAWCETETSRGIGTERVCELDKFSVRETFVEWDEGKSFRYVETGDPFEGDAKDLPLVPPFC